MKVSDRSTLHGEPAKIESIRNPLKNPHNWCVEAWGGGVTITETQ
jgi:hypothetical protein